MAKLKTHHNGCGPRCNLYISRTNKRKKNYRGKGDRSV